MFDNKKKATPGHTVPQNSGHSHGHRQHHPAHPGHHPHPQHHPHPHHHRPPSHHHGHPPHHPPYYSNQPGPNYPYHSPAVFQDYGPHPYVTDIEKATLQNINYRTTLWTGNHLQLTLMTIPVGESIGLEAHPDTDQFLRLEEGQGLVQMGPSREKITVKQTVVPNSAVFVPAGTWHNITNIGNTPMKLYSIYAPPHHPHGTVHPTKAIAEKMGD
ncbi:MAG: cupin domain-containing protein [Defluviitaleaceae bacterium]|nr:cupin domain-containing protein [Defluviitaleaceae bacterium]